MNQGESAGVSWADGQRSECQGRLFFSGERLEGGFLRAEAAKHISPRCIERQHSRLTDTADAACQTRPLGRGSFHVNSYEFEVTGRRKNQRHLSCVRNGNAFFAVAEDSGGANTFQSGFVALVTTGGCRGRDCNRSSVARQERRAKGPISKRFRCKDEELVGIDA